jgi:uncharacterized protein YbbK (DUF523 family)/uncharacterized protein YbgA (DUF1722 family)
MSGGIRLGVSSCLLGEAVRFDGGHKRDRFLNDLLGRHVEWVPVCPEVESGLGVPRPAMRLVREAGAVELREIASGRDHSARLRRFAARRVRELRALELCGYVLKKASPSCGMTRVRVYEKGQVRRDGSGLFASALVQALPWLPVEEEGRLADPALRENFVERVFAYRRLRDLFRGRWTRAGVVAFHTAHKLQLMAHSQPAYAELGRQVAAVARQPRAAPARAELAGVIDEYRRGLMPLVVPITLLRHHARAHSVGYLEGQTYLEPHPKELMLRNQI